MAPKVACFGLLLWAAQGLRLPQGLQLPAQSLRLCKRVGGDALALALATAPLAQAAQAAAPPSPASLELVQRALDASSQEQKDAVPLLGKAIEAWKKEKLADDELAGLYSLRAKAYQREGDAQKAEADLTAEVTLLKGNSDADPAELPRALLARARLEEARGAHGAARADAKAALALDEDLPNLEQRNPFSYELLARASARDGDFAAAARSFADAEAAHDRVGDAIRARNAAADRALALYATANADAVAETRRVFAQKSKPVSNNPDDVPLLQELSRKDAELHLALSARLYAKDDDRTDATALWQTGCLRLKTYVDDARTRVVADDAEDLGNDQRTKAKKNRALADAARSLAAVSVGLDPANPYVTQRTGQNFLWYEFEADGAGQAGEDYSPRGDAKVKRRRVGSTAYDATYGKLAKVDAALSCDAFTSEAWLAANRPEWPPELRGDAQKFASLAPKAVDVELPSAAPMTLPPKPNPLVKAVRGALK